MTGLFDPHVSQSLASSCWKVEGNPPGEEATIDIGEISGEGDGMYSRKPVFTGLVDEAAKDRVSE